MLTCHGNYVKKERGGESFRVCVCEINTQLRSDGIHDVYRILQSGWVLWEDGRIFNFHGRELRLLR